MDVTQKPDGERVKMDEMGLYTVGPEDRPRTFLLQDKLRN